MQDHNNIEARIQDYMDGFCTDAEALEIEQNIASDSLWKSTYDSLLVIHGLLQIDFEPMEPSLRFSKNIMEQVADIKIARPTGKYINPLFVWLVGGIFACMFLLLVVYAISLTDWSSAGSGGLFSLPQISLPTVNWASYLNGNTITIFLFVNTLLGLVLFDYWFSGKKKQKKQKMTW